MEKRAKKLTLSKETLRKLDDDKLTRVVGGDQTVVCVGQSAVCDSVAICQSGIC